VEDPRVKGRGISVAVLFIVALAALAAAPLAAATPGARLAFLRVTEHGVTLGNSAAGGGPISNSLSSRPGEVEPFFISPPSWSGDGESLLFLGGKPGKSRREEFAPRTFGLYAVPAEGGAPVLIPGTSTALFPIGLPDGVSVAVIKSRGHDSEETTTTVGSGKTVVRRTRSQASLWIVRLDGGPARQLTPWRANVIDIPTSASPDGRTLVITRRVLQPGKRKPPRSSTRTLLLDLATGRTRPVGPNVGEVAYSPDGSKLALVIGHEFAHPHVRKTKGEETRLDGQTDIYVEDIASGAMTPVSVGPALDFRPSWDPSGERLSFTRRDDPLGASFDDLLFGLGENIYEVNADGTCLSAIYSERKVGFIGPTWRPGAEHAAGRIAC
jgi:Tol biopolymer transport system component